jgi:hypothetical protein
VHVASSMAAAGAPPSLSSASVHCVLEVARLVWAALRRRRPICSHCILSTRRTPGYYKRSEAVGARTARKAPCCLLSGACVFEVHVLDVSVAEGWPRVLRTIGALNAWGGPCAVGTTHASVGRNSVCVWTDAPRSHARHAASTAPKSYERAHAHGLLFACSSQGVSTARPHSRRYGRWPLHI